MTPVEQQHPSRPVLTKHVLLTAGIAGTVAAITAAESWPSENRTANSSEPSAATTPRAVSQPPAAQAGSSPAPSSSASQQVRVCWQLPAESLASVSACACTKTQLPTTSGALDWLKPCFSVNSLQAPRMAQAAAQQPAAAAAAAGAAPRPVAIHKSTAIIPGWSRPLSSQSLTIECQKISQPSRSASAKESYGVMELEVMKFVAYCGGLTIKLRLDDLQFGHVDK